MTELGIVTNRLGLVGIIAIAACTSAPPPLECFDDEDCPPSNVCQQLTCVPGVQHQTGDAGQACPDAGCGVDGGEPTPDAGAPDAGFTTPDIGVVDHDAGEPLALFCFGTGQTAPVAPPELPADARIAFSTTERIRSGGGLASLDALCQRQADEAGLMGRTFVALTAPGPGLNVLSRFELDDGPWYRPDGVKVADGLLNLASEPLLAPVNTDAAGVYAFNRSILAGAFGTASAALHCGSWTSTLGQTRIGQSGSSTRFFRGIFAPCTSELHLLCFEVASNTGT